MNLPASADVVVIGSGIVGATTAAAIASRGASVILLEKEREPAREGSGRAQGSLRVQGRHAAEFPLAREALDLWRRAADEGDFEFVAGGNLYLCTAEGELPGLRHLVEEAHRAGLTDVQLLDADQTRELIPCATGAFYGAMWSPIDAQAQPAKATNYFVGTAERNGAAFAFGVKATRIVEGSGRVTGIDTARGPISAGKVVVAGGVWTPYLAGTVGVTVPLMPVIMSELETEPLPPLFDQTIRALGFGARQRPNGRTVVSAGLNARVRHDVTLADLRGLRFWLPRAIAFRRSLKLRLDIRRMLQQVRLGATRDTRLVPQTSPEPVIDRQLVDSSLRRLARVIPAFATAQAQRYWAGLVDMTPDGLPIIDSNVGCDGLTIVTGLCGHGLHLGPVLGEIAADLSLDGHTSRPIDAFSLSRFTSGRVGRPEMMI